MRRQRPPGFGGESSITPDRKSLRSGVSSALVNRFQYPVSRQSTYAVFAVFFVESAVLGNWIPRIPELKAKLELSDTGLGLCLLAVPLGTILGLLVAGRILEVIGLRKGCQLFLPLWALFFMLPSQANTSVLFAASLVLCGATVGLVEVAMNTTADAIERFRGIRIMSRCHGFWSLGSMAGAIAGSALAQMAIDVKWHFGVMMPLLAILGYVAASKIEENEIASADNTHADDASHFRLPSRAILLLCIMPLGIMSIEGAFIDWSAVFMDSILSASPWVIGLTYAFFSVVMASVRLSGDMLADRFGAYTIVRTSGLAAAAGIILFAMAPSVPVALLGAALSGLGVAVVYPMAVTAAARRPGRSSADNVAALTMISFCAFLVAPPIIGFISDCLGLRWALALLAPLALKTWRLASEVNPEKSQ
ncbi:MAG: MFS transporter [Granulosicoccaceae bacterium]